MADNQLERFFGGSPFWVAVRLILLSIVIGVLLHVLGFDPWNIWWSGAARPPHHQSRLGCDRFRLALFHPRRRAGVSDLADRAACARGLAPPLITALNQVGHGSAAIARASAPIASATEM